MKRLLFAMCFLLPHAVNAQPPVVTPDVQPIIINIPPPVTIVQTPTKSSPTPSTLPSKSDTEKRLDNIEKQLAELTAMLKEKEKKPEDEVILFKEPVITISTDMQNARSLIAMYNSNQRVGINGSIHAHMKYHGVPADVYTRLSPEDNLRLHSVIHHKGNTFNAACRNTGLVQSATRPSANTGCANGQCIKYVPVRR